MKRMAISAFASVFLLGIAGVAKAQEAPMAVKIGDLNLQTASGAMAAVRRVKSASSAFCGDFDPRQLKRTAAVLQCRREMEGKAINRIDAPMVTALYERTHPPVVLASQ